MNACIARETFVITVFRRVFHSALRLELCRHARRRRDPIISTCRYGKSMPTTALVNTGVKKRRTSPFKLNSLVLYYQVLKAHNWEKK